MIETLKLLAAEGTKKIDPGKIGVPKVDNANDALNGLLNVVYGAAGILCVIIIVFAGYIYVTSDGDAGNLKTAKNAIIGAVTGLIVVIAAFAITQFVLGRF
ncbi:MAG TPA: pilin [Candidatus Saccharimonadales bacterium]|nr:pilin [Candidatus Saccharimonadales bacterium]